MKLFQLLPKKLHGFACNQPSVRETRGRPKQERPRRRTFTSFYLPDEADTTPSGTTKR